MPGVRRVTNISAETFMTDYLVMNRPVIVTDAMDHWVALRRWTPTYFGDRFGENEVQVYDDLFTLEDITTLQSYLDQNFNQPPDVECSTYVRWYAKFKDVDFCWSDHAFGELSGDWASPYFLPLSSYCLPYVCPPVTARVEKDPFPFKGLFISGRGARTRLHRDPIGTQAILCQCFGEKSIRFYPPGPAGQPSGTGPDAEPAGGWHPVAEDVLRPGDLIFIPDGWYHDVTTLSDSISITWNFVHAARAQGLFDALNAAGPGEVGLDVVRYFLADHMAPGAGIADMLTLLRAAAPLDRSSPALCRGPIAERRIGQAHA